MANRKQPLPDKTSQEKLELAQKIAASSPRVAKTYASVENAFAYSLRAISSALNWIFLNPVSSKIFALVMAIVLYFVVNVSTDEISGISQSATLTDVPVEIVYNSEIYELSGVPSSVDIIITGDMGALTVQKNKTNSKVTLDLTGKTEGTYQIKLAPTNFSSDLDVHILDYPIVDVTIKKKIAQSYNISYEYVNTAKMDSTCILGVPTLSQTEVTIRASQDTLNEIAFVKALIDVTGVSKDFSKQANIVAFDNAGQIVSCDIFPSIVDVSAAVSSPSKDVPITIVLEGQLPNNLAIDSITLDKQRVTLYATPDVLETINEVVVRLDVSSINQNKDISKTLSKPSGVNSMSVTKVNLNVMVAERTETIINGVSLKWVNLDSSAYKAKFTNTEDGLVSVKVTGTENNIKNILAEDISAELDLSGLTEGSHNVPIRVIGSSNYVTFSPVEGHEEIGVILTKN